MWRYSNSSRIASHMHPESILWLCIHPKIFKDLLKFLKKYYYLPSGTPVLPRPLHTSHCLIKVNLGQKTSFLGSQETRVEYSTGVEYSGVPKKFFMIRSSHEVFPSQRVLSYLFNFLRNPNSIPPLFTPKRGGRSLSCS